MRVLLVSTYDLGRQPLGLASPAASLRGAGADVCCVDTSRQPLSDDAIRQADIVAFYLPMHTATRLAGPLVDRVRATNPAARLAAYGLYAPLNAEWLRARGVTHVLDAEGESALVSLAGGRSPAGDPLLRDPARAASASRSRRIQLVRPDRSTLAPLSRYAAVQMPDDSRRIAGSAEASRGCKHLCRHCPIVPVYGGRFSAVPLDLVMDDIRAQVDAGAQHITFGDPDFLNGPTHARRLVDRFHGEYPQVTYDVTIKIEHLLRHSDMLPLFRDTGCLFITSAVEAVDDAVLARLRKGHTRDDFRIVVERCREAGVTLSPTFIPFNPWTTVDGYLDLLDEIRSLDIVEHVAPVQLGIRLLVTARSSLLELDDIRNAVEPFDGESLTWPWRHADPAVDALHQDVMRVVAAGSGLPRQTLFARIAERAYAGSKRTPVPLRKSSRLRVPVLTESWYCCAEPMELIDPGIGSRGHP